VTQRQVINTITIARHTRAIDTAQEAYMNIMVIDDSEDSRDITEAALFTAGYRDIESASSAKEAYGLLKLDNAQAPARPIDLMLLDIVMPDIDGIEACARIRNDTRYVDVPIIMITSLGDMDSLANAFVAGATDYITKPVNRVELLARVRSALKLKAELERRLARERELLDFLSTWGDRRASLWIDEATGLFVGEVAEAYLTSVTEHHADRASIIALAIDRLDMARTSRGEEAAQQILSQVAEAVQQTIATVGVVAASYRNGLMVVIVPNDAGNLARKIAEILKAAVAKLAIANPEAIAANHVTLSMAIATSRVNSGADRVKLLSRAIAAAQKTAEAGGNRIVETVV
jgi:PleD family two-component response regulator